MTALLISDLHLSPERPAVTRAFFDFLSNKAATAKQLYILGDLFEAWIGDDDPSELAGDVQDQLKALSERGIEVYFQHGNRDFLVGKTFARNTGCKLLPELHLTSLAGVDAVLLHGDTLCTDDEDYQRFRRRYRRPFMIWLLRRLPLKKRQQVAADWRERSAMANANKPENIMDVSGDAVEQTMKKYGVKLMVHGHTHRPDHHQYPYGERIVLGDWHHKGWYVEADGRGISLNSFDINAIEPGV